MTKRASFVADLPPAMSPLHLEKLYGWGKSSCVRFDVHMGADESMTLVATRKKEATARDHMRLLHTCLRNWGVDVPKRAGWLRLVGHSDSSIEPAENQTEPPEQNVAATPDVAGKTLGLLAQKSEAFVRSDGPPAPLVDEAHTPTSESEQDAGAKRGVDRYATSRAEGSAQLIAATNSARTAARLRAPINLLCAIPVH